MSRSTYIDDLAARIREETPPSLVPSDADPSEVAQLFRLYAVLGMACGHGVSAANVHDAWSVWMHGRGQGDHESIVPFEELDDEAQKQDGPFVRAIRAALDD